MKVPVEMGYLQKTRTEWLKMGWWGSDGCRSIKSALFALHILSSSVANLSKHSYNKKKKLARVSSKIKDMMFVEIHARILLPFQKVAIKT